MFHGVGQSAVMHECKLWTRRRSSNSKLGMQRERLQVWAGAYTASFSRGCFQSSPRRATGLLSLGLRPLAGIEAHTAWTCAGASRAWLLALARPTRIKLSSSLHLAKRLLVVDEDEALVHVVGIGA